MVSTYHSLQPIVCDNGTGTIKAGFAGDETPTVVFSPVIGRLKQTDGISDQIQKQVYVGDDEVMDKRDLLKLSYPIHIHTGIIKGWDNMEKIWQNLFYKKLHVDPEEHPVIMTECPLNWKSHKEKMTQVMFESFNVPALYVAVDAVLSLYATGRKTGLVLDLGDRTHVVPVYEGFYLPHASSHFPFAGRDLTDYLFSILIQKDQISSSMDRKIIQDIKEKHCYLALDFRKELEATKNGFLVGNNYKLPDGQIIRVGIERFQCPEALFDPSFFASESCGLHHAIHSSIMKCDVDIRKDICDNVVLCGGTSMIPGLANRLRKEINEFDKSNMEVNVVAQLDGMYSAWRGGSALASIGTFPQMCISKAEHDEYGPTIVHRKCF